VREGARSRVSASRTSGVDVEVIRPREKRIREGARPQVRCLGYRESSGNYSTSRVAKS
jgi:hypothetical protein